jgi:small subunit ribosomal protein S17
MEQTETPEQAATPAATPEQTATRGARQVKTGVVVSNAMEKTVVVRVERTYKHPLYQRYVKSSRKLTAHDEQNQCNVGDVVSIVSCRPLSRTKRWRLKEVVKRAE